MWRSSLPSWITLVFSLTGQGVLWIAMLFSCPFLLRRDIWIKCVLWLSHFTGFVSLTKILLACHRSNCYYLPLGFPNTWWICVMLLNGSLSFNLGSLFFLDSEFGHPSTPSWRLQYSMPAKEPWQEPFHGHAPTWQMSAFFNYNWWREQ